MHQVLCSEYQVCCPILLHTKAQRSAHCIRCASTLVVGEHNEGKLTPITKNTISAAKTLGGDVSVVVAGGGIGDIAKEIAELNGVSKVLVAENDAYNGLLPGTIIFIFAINIVCCWCVLVGAYSLVNIPG